MQKILIRLFAALLFFPTHFGWRSRKKIVFGAWHGARYSDNPRYLFEWLSEHTDWDLIWTGRKELAAQVKRARPGVRFAKRGSLAALWHVLTAKAFVYCHNFWEDIGPFPIKQNLIRLNVTHGIPFKKLGAESASKTEPRSMGVIERIRNVVDPFLFDDKVAVCVSSDGMAAAYKASWPEMFVEFIYAGTPRGDFMRNFARDEKRIRELRDEYAKLLGIDASKKWIIYMPTHRWTTMDLFSFASKVEDQALANVLKNKNAVIIEKPHFNSLQQRDAGNGNERVCIINRALNGVVDASELLLAGDLLITDYSSCFFDFALMNRPVIHFAYDYEFYRNSDTGLRYELRDIAAGPVCESYDELLSALAQPECDLMATRGSRLNDEMLYETGSACEQIRDWLARRGVG